MMAVMLLFLPQYKEHLHSMVVKTVSS